MSNRIAFIGAGSMAEAIISGLISNNYANPANIVVTNKTNKARLNELKEKYGVAGSQNLADVVADASILFLAMKPKDITSALQQLKPYLQHNQIIVSVLAGVSTSYIANTLGMNIAVIRAMPNTSAMISKSATAITAGEFATAEQLRLAEGLLQAIGTTTIVTEDQMHTITALSGSGPAYFYYMIEAMEETAVKAGLDKKVVKQLLTQTIAGVAEMLQSTDEEPKELRRKITSPGGTTQAGIETLQAYQFDKAIEACMNQAAKRSRELGETFEK